MITPKRQDGLFRRVLVAILLVSIIPLLAACGGSGNSAGGGDSGNYAGGGGPEAVNEGAQLSGKVSLGNIEGSRAYITGVKIKAMPLDTQTRSMASATQASAGAYETTVDSSGGYSLLLPPGDYMVEASGGSTRKSLARVALSAGSTESLDFVLTATGTITGQLASYSESGFSTVVFIPGTSYIALTDGTGSFALSDVPVGTYTLQVGDQGDNIFGTVSVNVVPGKNELGRIDLAAQRPTVIHASVQEGRVISPRELKELNLEFSQPMDPASTEAALSTNPALADLTFNWAWDNRLLTITNFADKVRYGVTNLTVGTGATAQNGQGLESAYSLNFTVDERILHTFPVDGDRVYLDNMIPVSIEFSEAIDHGKLKVDVSPQPAGGIEIQWNERSAGLFGSFVMGEEYTVTVQDAVTERDGRKIHGLPREMTFQVVAPEIHSSTPANRALEVNPENTVVLRFNTIMDRDSVEAGLQVHKGGVAGNPVAAEEIDLSWGVRSFYAHGGINSRRDRLRINLPMDYATEYTIVLNGAKVLSGVEMEDYALTFTTLKPRLVETSPARGETVEQLDRIVLHFNSRVDIADGVFLLQDSNNNPIELRASVTDDPWGGGTGNWHGGDPFSQFPSRECINCHGSSDPYAQSGAGVGGGSAIVLAAKTQVPAGELYTLNWSGLKAADKITDIAAGQVQFQTASRRVISTWPANGEVGVGLVHSFRIQFNDLFNEAEQGVIEAALTTTAVNAKDGIRHPEPLFIWDVNRAGNSRLLVNFTFDPGTNYKFTFAADANGNVVDGEDKIVMKAPAPVIFTTAGETTAGTVNLLQSLSIKDGQVVEAANNSVELRFNRRVHLSPGDLALKAGEELIDLQGIYLDGYIGWNSTTVNGVLYGDRWRIELPLSYDQSYTFTVKEVADLCGIHPNYDWRCTDPYQQQLVNNLPLTVDFSTSGPQLYIWVDNVAGILELDSGSWHGHGSSSGSYEEESTYTVFKTADLLSALATNPALGGTWDFEQDEMPEYVRRAVLSYPPVQYANIQVKLDELIAHEAREVYNQDTESFDVNYSEISLFENTPLSEVFGVEPNLTLPVLTRAEALGLNRVQLTFNTNMDAALAGDLGNYAIVDENGGALEIIGVEPAANDNFYNREVILITAEQELGAVYTVTVSNLTEWGGHYTIEPEQASATFEAYRGRIEGYTRIHRYYDEDGIYTPHLTVLVKFDVEIDPDSVTSENLALWGRNHDNYYYGDYEFHPLEDVETQWNADHTAVTLTFSWTDSDWWDFRLYVDRGILNAGEVPVRLGGSPGLRWISSSDSLSFSVDTSSAFSDENPTLGISFNTPHSSLVVEAQVAGDPENYQLTDRDNPDLTMPNVTAADIDLDNGNQVTLSLSGPLPLDLWESGYYTLIVTNIAPPGSLWEGTGLYPPVKRDFHLWWSE